jgi:hypothetical protein
MAFRPGSAAHLCHGKCNKCLYNEKVVISELRINADVQGNE